MKKLFLSVLVLLSFAANAQYFRPHHYHSGWGWVAPTVIGGVVGYEIARSQQPVIVQQPPVIVQQPQVMVVPSPAPQGYHWEQLLDGNCHCYKMVLVQN
jgi:hypothetical protein